MSKQDQPLLTGESFEDGYEVLAKLGEGGFGAVYKARQLTTGQIVALKVMRHSEPGDTAQAEKRTARFLREAQLLADLHHPNIVQLVDTGRSKDGSLYSVFAFSPGDNLGALFAREGALAPREAQHLMLEVLDALTCAHAAGVIHRDIKPSNIMVIASGARRNALVLDFGIGVMIPEANHRAGDASPRLTGSHDALGTPGYGAPEQWRGVEPSARADLFSWGLVFLECLLGEPVYRGTPAEVFYQLLGPEPVPIPPALDGHPLGDILRSATHKDVAARDVTARGLFAALEACDLRNLSRQALRGPGGGVRTDPSSTLSIDDAWRRLPPERRQVTALCCHVEAGAGAAEGEKRDLALRTALTSASAVARRHGGRVVGGLGSDLLVYFGYPRAAEDDALRAGRAALAITETVPASVGVHTGMVMAGDAGGVDVAVGTTPRLAALLAARAAPGSVVVTAAAQGLLRAAFELTGAGGELDADTFLLRRERDAQRVGPFLEGPLVGRAEEMSLLLERWSRALGGAGSAGLITGEPGIGKSRLVHELRRRVQDDDHVFLEGRCSPDTQNSALLPVVELLGRALGVDQELDAEARVRRLEEQLGNLGIALAEAMPVFLPLFSLPIAAPYAPLDVSPQRLKTLTLNATVSLLSSLAELHPLLLVVEDLHWADPSTSDLLAQLVREAPSFPMCVFLTARPEYSPLFSTMGMLHVPLARLSRQEVEVLVTDLMGKKAVPAEVLDQVASRTEGVPLFVEELTRMMTDVGVLVERDDHYDLVGQLSDLEMPRTLRALLTARLDRTGRAKETAQVAAALGREFSMAVLSAVSSPGAEVQEDLDRLANAGLVLRKRRSRDPVGVFKHALVRDAAYESLSRGGRLEVHTRIAGTLEQRFPEVVRTRPDLLAYHHAAAEQKALAVPYAQRAAEHGLGRSAYAEAIAHASNVAEWVGALDPGVRVEAELSANGVLTQAMMASRGWADPEVKARVDRSTALLVELGEESLHRVPTLWSLFTYHHVASNRRDARAAAEEIVAIAERSGDPGLRAAAAAALGTCLYADGTQAEARRVLTRVVEEYDPGRHRDHGVRYGLDSLVLAKTLLGHLAWLSGDVDEAFALVIGAVDWARETGHMPSVGIGLLYGCSVYQLAGDKDRVAAMAGEILALSAKFGLPAYEAYAAILHSWVTGDDNAAEAILGGLLSMGCKAGLSYYGALLADAWADRGRLDVAIARIDRCLGWCQENDEHYFEPELHRLRAAYLLRGTPADEDQARAALETAVRLARQLDEPRIEALALLDLERLLPGAKSHGPRLEEIFCRHPALRLGAGAHHQKRGRG